MLPLLLLVLVAGGAAGYWYFKVRGVISTDDAFIDGNRVAIAAKMLGRIVELNADEGDTVRLGELLVRLDEVDLRAQEAQAQGNLVYAEQNVQLTEVERQRAHDDFDRATIQFEGKVISQEQYDHIKSSLDMAEARHAVALAQVQTAKARLRVIEAQLENTRISSPISGVVAKRWVLTGDVVQPGQPILAIYDLSDVWVTANFEETKLRDIHVADSVQISVDAYPGRDLTGRVAFVGAAAASQFSLIPPNNASGNFTKVTQRIPVRISIQHSPAWDDAPLLLPGMSVTVRIRRE